MIKGVARAVVKPQHKERFLELAREFVTKNRAEQGNISYNLYIGMEDSCLLTFIEEWESAEALAKHLKSEHFLRLQPQLEKLQQGPTQADVYLESDF